MDEKSALISVLAEKLDALTDQDQNDDCRLSNSQLIFIVAQLKHQEDIWIRLALKKDSSSLFQYIMPILPQNTTIPLIPGQICT